MVMDIALLVIGTLVVTYSTIEGFARSVIQLLIFYVVTLMIGMVLLSIAITQDLANRIARMLGSAANISLFEVLLYLGILVPTTVGIFLLTHFTMDNLPKMKLEWLDTILALIVGIILALVLMSLLANAWGIIASLYWRPEQTWWTVRNAYVTSLLQPHLENILDIYRAFLFPFRMSRYPAVYLPPRL